MTDCIFCKIFSGEIPSVEVYKDDNLLTFMDLYPESKGHMLIVPKEHHENIYTLDNITLARIIQLSKPLAIAAKKALNADGVKIIQYNEAAAGQTVFHYHMHVIPVYKEGLSHQHHSKEADLEALRITAEKIKVELLPLLFELR